MKEQIKRIAEAMGRAYEHAQNLEIQSTRGNVMHLAGCFAALEEAIGAVQGIKIPDAEVPEEEVPEEEVTEVV